MQVLEVIHSERNNTEGTLHPNSHKTAVQCHHQGADKES